MDAQAWLDHEDAHIAAMVRGYGWFIQYVGGDQCSWPFVRRKVQILYRLNSLSPG